MLYQRCRISIKVLVLAITFLISACAFNEPIIEHDPTGTIVKVRDDIPLGEAKEVIGFIYDNFKSIRHEYIGEYRNFTSLTKVYRWNNPAWLRPECKYMVDFYYPNSPNKYSNSGDTLCIGIISNQFKIEDFSHWLE